MDAALGSEQSLDTLHDYEIGLIAAAARISDLEALYAEAHADPRVALLLARAWCRVSFDFTLDAYEQALDSDDAPLAAYHRERARAGFERAAYYADAWLEAHAPGFEKARESGAELAPFLDRNLRDASAAEGLLWAGFARLEVAQTLPSSKASDAALETERAVLLLRRALGLDANAAHGFAHLALALATLQANTPDPNAAALEFAQADRAAHAARLLVPLLRARTLACRAHDRKAFEDGLEHVLQASDPDPSLRLENAAAKRRARRYLTSAWLARECFEEAAH